MSKRFFCTQKYIVYVRILHMSEKSRNHTEKKLFLHNVSHKVTTHLLTTFQNLKISVVCVFFFSDWYKHEKKNLCLHNFCVFKNILYAHTHFPLNCENSANHTEWSHKVTAYIFCTIWKSHKSLSSVLTNFSKMIQTRKKDIFSD